MCVVLRVYVHCMCVCVHVRVCVCACVALVFIRGQIFIKEFFIWLGCYIATIEAVEDEVM